MRRLTIFKRTLLVAFALFLVTPVLAQKKNKIRIKAQIIQVMDQATFIDLVATSRIDGQNTEVSGIEFDIFNNTHGEKTKIGSISTNENGKSRFVLKDFNSMSPDSTGLFAISIAFNGNEEFSKAKKSIEFRKANLTANLIEKDSINFVQATLKDAFSMEPIEDESLIVQVQRLFRPLQIGGDFHMTGNAGDVEVKIPSDIPGIDGMLNVEVVLLDNDTYGTVKSIISAPIGAEVAIEDNFNKRAMWGTRAKTPLFILIFANLLLLGIGILFIYLTKNLINISKL